MGRTFWKQNFIMKRIARNGGPVLGTVLLLLAVSMGSVFLCGCGAGNGEETGQMSAADDAGMGGPIQGADVDLAVGEDSESILSMETEPVLNYVYEPAVPGLRISQSGFDVNGSKRFLTVSEERPTACSLIDLETGETVYTIYPERYDTDPVTGLYMAESDFSDYREPGTYRIFHETLGYSYAFVIEENHYELQLMQAMDSMLTRMQKLGTAGVSEVGIAMGTLLLSYELYAKSWQSLSDDKVPTVMALLKNMAEWMLTCQEDTGAILIGGEPDEEATMIYAAAMTKFGYSYQSYDSKYANACLQAADRAYSYVQKNGKENVDSALFWASAELYRATGKYAYRNAANALGEEMAVNTGDRAQVLGILTYSYTKRRVSSTLCTSLMKDVFALGSDIAERALPDSTGTGERHNTVEDELWEMSILAAINYIITNREYGIIIERNLEYVEGGGEQALNYVADAGCENPADTPITDNCASLAAYMSMLAEVIGMRE